MKRQRLSEQTTHEIIKTIESQYPTLKRARQEAVQSLPNEGRLITEIMSNALSWLSQWFLRRGLSSPTTAASSSIRNGSLRNYSVSSSTTLSKQQEQVLRAIATGRSVFITGSAGTGKSFLLLEAIKLIKQIHDPHEVFVTASTGVAACALNGQTLHSFSGVGLGDCDQNLLLHRVCKNKPAYKRWRVVKALIIDEISMVSGELFDKLEYIARQIRSQPGNQSPWGGIQLIVSGDFFQLPPILKSPDSDVKEFAFEAECWNFSFDLQVELTRVYRQSDALHLDLLQGIRKGLKNDQHLEILRRCNVGTRGLSGNVPRLYPRNVDVKRVNEEELRRLGGNIVNYSAVDRGKEPWKNQLKHGIAPGELQICLGARVMLIKNKDVEVGLVNGATGTVIDFVKSERAKVRKICKLGLLPKVRFDCGVEMEVDVERWVVMEGDEVLATRKQVPLILAWALSVHKCQGMTLDVLHTDLSRAFGCGMVYVALSRVRSLDGLHLSGFDSSKIMANPKVLQFYQSHLDGQKLSSITNAYSSSSSSSSSANQTKHNQRLVDCIRTFLLSAIKS